MKKNNNNYHQTIIINMETIMATVEVIKMKNLIVEILLYQVRVE